MRRATVHSCVIGRRSPPGGSFWQAHRFLAHAHHGTRSIHERQQAARSCCHAPLESLWGTYSSARVCPFHATCANRRHARALARHDRNSQTRATAASFTARLLRFWTAPTWRVTHTRAPVGPALLDSPHCNSTLISWSRTSRRRWPCPVQRRPRSASGVGVGPASIL